MKDKLNLLVNFISQKIEHVLLLNKNIKKYNIIIKRYKLTDNYKFKRNENLLFYYNYWEQFNELNRLVPMQLIGDQYNLTRSGVQALIAKTNAKLVDSIVSSEEFNNLRDEYKTLYNYITFDHKFITLSVFDIYNILTQSTHKYQFNKYRLAYYIFKDILPLILIKLFQINIFINYIPKHNICVITNFPTDKEKPVPEDLITQIRDFVNEFFEINIPYCMLTRNIHKLYKYITNKTLIIDSKLPIPNELKCGQLLKFYSMDTFLLFLCSINSTVLENNIIHNYKYFNVSIGHKVATAIILFYQDGFIFNKDIKELINIVLNNYVITNDTQIKQLHNIKAPFKLYNQLIKHNIIPETWGVYKYKKYLDLNLTEDFLIYLNDLLKKEFYSNKTDTIYLKPFFEKYEKVFNKYKIKTPEILSYIINNFLTKDYSVYRIFYVTKKDSKKKTIKQNNIPLNLRNEAFKITMNYLIEQNRPVSINDEILPILEKYNLSKKKFIEFVNYNNNIIYRTGKDTVIYYKYFQKDKTIESYLLNTIPYYVYTYCFYYLSLIAKDIKNKKDFNTLSETDLIYLIEVYLNHFIPKQLPQDITYKINHHVLWNMKFIELAEKYIKNNNLKLRVTTKNLIHLYNTIVNPNVKEYQYRYYGPCDLIKNKLK
ncbi:hypothetical protein DEFDS_P198 (plasmid) [Deferribacter desulfuricans SSM1]|uniref:Uncharacterized protein n=1 Tax=Deferribacter desulfuricans (strain DSM 14783 / JCM 11476 / NBRC 101012 / SSM1) TaxID=639282 RepID=D3PF26_DEFDS|nr:hypothetical protein [Deferribacter desulfuricans]BAI81818.1 hypothetical protein DEFDS_P198 [Deferribacter desulfuricans SSM1]